MNFILRRERGSNGEFNLRIGAACDVGFGFGIEPGMNLRSGEPVAELVALGGDGENHSELELFSFAMTVGQLDETEFQLVLFDG